MAKLVIHPPVDNARERAITEAARSMGVVNAFDEFVAEHEIVDADAFFGRITPPMLAASTRLKWVQSPTASLEHYLFPELIAHPCTLTNMRGLFHDVIAEHVFAFILSFTRNLHIYIRQQMEARWEAVGGEEGRHPFPLGQSFVTAVDRAHGHLEGKTLGIVGLGSVGSEVARRGAAFGMELCAVDPNEREITGLEVRLWRPARLPELLRVSDFVVVAAPHTPETEGLFRREQFRQMKPEAYFINIGRGVIADLTDLTAALEAGEIAGAGLDVFEVEPLPPDHALWRMENVILTPHVASNSTHIAARHLEMLLENIRRFAVGEPLRNVVNKRMWY